MIGAALRASVEARLGQRITSCSRLSGGDINDAFAVALSGGETVFLKVNDTAPPEMFGTEARGLDFLREASALRIPRVLGHGEGGQEPAFLLLEFIAPAPRKPAFDEELGRGLAALHRAGAPSFGYREANFIGRLPQPNHEHELWPEFYRQERLQPQLAAAVAKGYVSPAMRRDFERLFALLPERTGDPEPPARLHGDLWSGNLHVTESGLPCLIDPAVYGGHREMDLAMMRLFGGFSPRVFAAYEEAYPLCAGHSSRVALCQLYPLLVHVNLFGKSYLGALAEALSASL